MLSGIGPSAHLREIGIDVRVDSPGVGANLDDHVEGLVFWEAARPMVSDVDAVVGDRAVHHRRFGRGARGQPDLMMHYGSVPFDMNTLRRGYPTTDNGFCLTPNVTQGRSRGTVRLRTPRLPRPAAGRPAVLHRPRRVRRPDHAGRRAAGPHDRRAVTAGGVGGARAGAGTGRDDRRRTARLHSSVPQHRVPPGRDGADGCGRAIRWRCSTRSCGSRASTGLRVVDASAMPKLPAVNPNITVMTMAEKCADLIRARPAADPQSGLVGRIG